jgi:pyridoxal phosphate enzyme (YggS family)
MSNSANAPLGWDSAQIKARIQTVQRSMPASVQLIAVTKTFPAAVVRLAYEAGIRNFGENKVQEAIAKQSELTDLTDVTWHFIGHLQSNKAAKALHHFDWIHTVDSLRLAEKLNHLSSAWPRLPHCCLQVKILPDPNKYGFTVPELKAALPQLNQLQYLKLRGLMTIPPYGLSPDQTKSVFDQTRQLAADINQMQLANLQMDTLSMGMSADFSIAIAAGATFIRLGTTLFGPRVTA